MPVEFEIKVVKIGNSLRITIPQEIVRSMKLAKGDKVGIALKNSHFEVRKIVALRP